VEYNKLNNNNNNNNNERKRKQVCLNQESYLKKIILSISRTHTHHPQMGKSFYTAKQNTLVNPKGRHQIFKNMAKNFKNSQIL
jgi:hypothetical protein